MSTVKLFKARKDSVVMGTQGGDAVVISGVDPDLARGLAAKLNETMLEAEQPDTRREQKFTVTFSGSISYVTDSNDEEAYTVDEMKRYIREYVDDFDELLVGMRCEKPRINFTVKKVYDKEVPND